MPEAMLPYPDSYWVIPGKLLAGEYPGSIDERMLQHKLNRLLDVGVSHFIDLTRENDARPYYPRLVEEAELRGLIVLHERKPIRDFYIPDTAQMKDILDSIDRALANNETTYVHCVGGIGRTGTVIGCFLVRHGNRGEEALEMIKQLRKDVPDWWVQSPETETQRQFVIDWQIGQ